MPIVKKNRKTNGIRMFTIDYQGKHYYVTVSKTATVQELITAFQENMFGAQPIATMKLEDGTVLDSKGTVEQIKTVCIMKPVFE